MSRYALLLALAVALLGAAWLVWSASGDPAEPVVTTPVRSGYDVLDQAVEAEAVSALLDSATVALIVQAEVEAARLEAEAAGYAKGFREAWAAVPRASDIELARARRLPLDRLAAELTDSLASDVR